MDFEEILGKIVPVRRRQTKMPTREETYKAIDSERDYQRSRANKVDGQDAGEHKHSTAEFLLYMQDYLTEAIHQESRYWTPGGTEDPFKPSLHTLRKITALGVACMEQNGAPQREGFER